MFCGSLAEIKIICAKTLWGIQQKAAFLSCCHGIAQSKFSLVKNSQFSLHEQTDCTQELTEKKEFAYIPNTCTQACIFRAQSVNELWRQDVLNSRGPKTSPRVLGTTVLLCICSCSHCLSQRLMHKSKNGTLTQKNLTAPYKHQPSATLSHRALLWLLALLWLHQLPDWSPKEGLKWKLWRPLSRQSLLKIARLKWEWKSLHT